MITAKKLTAVVLGTALAFSVSFNGNIMADNAQNDGDTNSNPWASFMNENISSDGDVVENPFVDLLKKTYDETFDGDILNNPFQDLFGNKEFDRYSDSTFEGDVNDNPWLGYLKDDEDDGDVMDNPWSGYIVETTQAPTTQHPTEAPTTQAPTTQHPTEAPTTQAPTTQRPTQAPTTQRPTQAPTTQRPTQAPTTQAQTTKAPETTEFEGDVGENPWKDIEGETEFDGDVISNPWIDEEETTEFEGDVGENPWKEIETDENDGDVFENPWADEYANQSSNQVNNSPQPKNNNVNQISEGDAVAPIAMLNSAQVKKTTVKVAVAKADNKTVKISLKKVKGVKGYHIQIAKKKFKKKSIIYTYYSKKSNVKLKTKKALKKLKFKGKNAKKFLKKHKVYFRVRVYIQSKGKKVYGKWSTKRRL